jgi:NAD(P)H-nitrite reductase large subunit
MLQDLGIELLPRTEARRVLSDDGVTGVELIEGGALEADLCLIATGILPNSELAEAATSSWTRWSAPPSPQWP